MEINAEKVRAQISLRILPLIFLIYVVAYLDRANVAFAKASISADLYFSEAMFGLGAGIFYLGYLALEIPGALLVELFFQSGLDNHLYLAADADQKSLRSSRRRFDAVVHCALRGRHGRVANIGLVLGSKRRKEVALHPDANHGGRVFDVKRRTEQQLRLVDVLPVHDGGRRLCLARAILGFAHLDAHQKRGRGLHRIDQLLW